MNDTDIEYLDKTWNPEVGCTKGCPWCWARRQAKRQKHNCRRCYDFKPHLHPERLDEPLRTREPSVIGVAFMGDLFDPTLPDGDRDRVFAAMALANRHTFCILTKQPERMRVYLNNKDRLLGGIWDAFTDDHVGPSISTADDVRKWCKRKGMSERERDRRMGIIQNAGGFWFGRPDLTPNAFWPLPNVIPGVSVEDQASADRLIPELMECKATRRIVSIEPMRGPVNPDHSLRRFRERGFEGAMKIDGIILGGQTGPEAVPTNPDWVRSVRDQCQAAGVPFFFKQWGEWLPFLAAGARQAEDFGDRRGALVTLGDGTQVRGEHRNLGRHDEPIVDAFRVGRKAAGRMLDGKMHDEVAWGHK